MKRLSEFIKWYIYITISILAVCTVIFNILSDGTIPAATLWQILLSGFLTTVVTVLLTSGEWNKISTVIIRVILHYISLCIVMVLCGKGFGWLSFDFNGIALMAGAVAVVYVLSFGVYYIIDLKQADEINQRLKEKYSDEE